LTETFDHINKGHNQLQKEHGDLEEKRGTLNKESDQIRNEPTGQQNEFEHSQLKEQINNNHIQLKGEHNNVEGKHSESTKEFDQITKEHKEENNQLKEENSQIKGNMNEDQVLDQSNNGQYVQDSPVKAKMQPEHSSYQFPIDIFGDLPYKFPGDNLGPPVLVSLLMYIGIFSEAQFPVYASPFKHPPVKGQTFTTLIVY